MTERTHAVKYRRENELNSGSLDHGQFHDPRTPDERKKDRRAVNRQATALSGSTDEDKRRRVLTRAVQSRRAGRAGYRQIDIVRGTAGRETPIVLGELLTRDGLRTNGETWAMLRDVFQTDEPEAVDCLDSRLVRWSNPGLDSKQLDETARAVRASGFQASVNHISPLGLIIKAQTS